MAREATAAPSMAPSVAMDWRSPKAAAGLSPDAAASSPMRALEGASRMPLATLSKICVRARGGHGKRGWRGAGLGPAAAECRLLQVVHRSIAARQLGPTPPLTLAKATQWRHAVVPATAATAPQEAYMGLLTAVRAAPRTTILAAAERCMEPQRQSAVDRVLQPTAAAQNRGNRPRSSQQGEARGGLAGCRRPHPGR